MTAVMSLDAQQQAGSGGSVSRDAQEQQQPPATSGRGGVSRDAQQARGRGSVWREIQGFNIVLVVGENQSSGASSDTLPGGAKRALTDMREFLPYKSYRVLDSQWTSCCSPESVRAGYPVSGRLQGVSGSSGSTTVLSPRSYQFTLIVGESSDRIPVKFALRTDEPAARSGQSAVARERERELSNLRSELETIAVQISASQRRVEAGVLNPDEVKLLQVRQAQLQRQVAELSDAIVSSRESVARTVMDSSFTMDAGETVVVGTSRLGGDKALIALVTAVRRTSSGR
jgi:hypothetical protein